MDKRVILLGGGLVAVVLSLVGFATGNPPVGCLPLPLWLLIAWALGLTR